MKSFGAGEIPSFLYLFDEAELAHLLDLRSSLRASKTVSGGEFGWGGTSVK